MNILKALYRYPVKGFPGEPLKEVELRLNEGLPGDRATALSNGIIPVNPPGEWTPCQAFQRMTIRPDLTTFQIVENRIYSKDHENTDLGSVKDIFGDTTVIHQSITKRGHWDHRDSAISIINIGTIEAIAKVTGQRIDPLRFRANLYIHAEPWSEFNWVGQEISFDDESEGESTILNIIRPIDRCRATSVDVKTGKKNINMPAALMRHFGYVYCGVYATVKQPGKITPGANFNISNQVSDQQMIDAITQKTVGHPSVLPRSAEVINVKIESEGINSLWIDDSFSALGSLKKYQAGQYIRLHNLSETHTWRSYTISEVKDDRIRITVKRDSGKGSQAVHQLNQNDKIIISGPFGDATLNDKSEAIHFISAGIGITPTVAKIQALVEDGYPKSVCISHVARSLSELVLWDDVLAAAKRLPDVNIHLYLTSNDGVATDENIDDVIYGRPDYQTLANQSKDINADVHLCGPEGFVDSIAEALKDIGISDERVFIDRFTSPDVDVEIREILPSKPIKVTLALSNIIEYWKPEDGPLLEFIEGLGVIKPSHCRTGLCKTCNCRIISGSATRLIGEEGEDSDETLLCSSVPKGPLVLEV
ncbi:MAG: FAD-binding oxidoreductase [Cocleimonas sp.]